MPIAILKLVAGLALTAACGSLLAQPTVTPAPQNLIQLSASASVEVSQDMLTMSLNTVRDGADASTVQNQLKAALEAGLTEAKKSVLPGQLDVRTGNFSLYPRYGRDGKPTGWQGSAELILEGRDFARISTTAGKIQSLTMGGVSFGLSRELRVKSEAEAQTLAIERFKSRATDIARSFGFTSFGLREVSVNANDQGFMPRPRLQSIEAKAAMSEAPVPVEAGKSSVTVTVSGSVQLK